MLGNIYNTILTQPLLNLLIVFYHVLWSDIGLAIIALTILIRLVLYPSFKHQLESQKKLSQLQPKMKEIKDKHKDNPEQQSKALMEFYKKEKVNPLGSCLPILVQLIILIALYRVFIVGLNGETLSNLYSFVPNPGHIEPVTLGLLNLSERNVILAVLTGIVQFFQSKSMSKLQPAASPGSSGEPGAAIAQTMTKQFVYVFPVITVLIGMQLPAGLVLYWLVTTVFSIGQQYIIMRGNQNAT